MSEQKTIKTAFTAKEVAFLFGLSPGTLANWRSKRVGPRFYKLNHRKVCYFKNDLEVWAKSNPIQTIDSI